MIAKKTKCPGCGGNDFDIESLDSTKYIREWKWRMECKKCGCKTEFFAPDVKQESALEFYENKQEPYSENVEAGTKEEPFKPVSIGNIITAGNGGSGGNGWNNGEPQTWDGFILKNKKPYSENIEFLTKEEYDEIHQSVRIGKDGFYKPGVAPKPTPPPVQSEPKNQIKDSGERTKFESGAVRDMHEGKGRCDLLPLWVIARINNKQNPILMQIDNFRKSNAVNYLFEAVHEIIKDFFNDNFETAILEVAIHFEEGANKYEPRNWEIGIPVHSFIDYAIRHYLKHKRGDTDERHDRACLWNLVCAIWTVENKPELNDFSLKK